MSLNFTSHTNEDTGYPNGMTTMVLNMIPYPPYGSESYREDTASSLRSTPETRSAPFQIIQCQAPTGKRYSKRIRRGEWQAHWPKIVELHATKATRNTILERLAIDCDFHPTPCQLNRQMENEGLGKGGKITAGKGRTGKTNLTHLDQDFYELELDDTSPPSQPPSLGRTSFDEDGSWESLYVPDFEHGMPRTPDLTDNALGGLGLVIGTNKVREELSEERENQSDTPFLDNTNPVGCSDYCQQACCAKLIQHHRSLLAANFLTCLQCWSQASEILGQLISDMEVDESVSVSDRTWVKINYNRMNGTLFQPDHRTSIWSTSGYTDMAKPLDEYLEEATSESLSNPLAHLCMTGQFRATGEFEYYLPNSVNLDSFDKQVQALYLELVEREEQNRSILTLMIWCSNTLKSSNLLARLEQISKQTTYTSRFREQILPRLLACHFVSEWINEPCQITMRLLAKFRARSRTIFKLDVMLPETFAVIGGMVTARTDCTVYSSTKSLSEGLLKSLKKATRKLWDLNAEEYCHEFAARTAEIYNQSSAYGQQATHFNDNFAIEVANQIIGRSSCYEGPFEWMRSADTFKVHDIGRLDTEVEATTEPSLLVDPRKLRTESSSSSKSTLGQLSTFSAPESAMNASSTSSTIDLLVRKRRDVAIQGSPEPTPAKHVKQRPEIPPRRYHSNTTNRTNSSGRRIYKEMTDMSGRSSAEASARKEGAQQVASRTASTLSKMSLGTQYSFRQVFGVDRNNSRTLSSPNRDSFVGGEEVLMVDAPAALHERILRPSGQQREGLLSSDPRQNTRVFSWVEEVSVHQHEDALSPRRSYIAEDRIDEE